ncbi:succinate dehydrogenase, hydrophobic membrane anchor protein [Pelagibacteraceae bacterium]|nr:succinate dehydrogenase, hydrophobic membrane anchor protein [Pelagibacteraceae bacterium]
MNNSTKKWLILKLSSTILMPLMLWFIVNFVSIYDSDYSSLIIFFSKTSTIVLFSLFIIVAFSFFSLTVSEIFEDYIHNNKIKSVATKTLNIFAIMMPLITILCIFNLN